MMGVKINSHCHSIWRSQLSENRESEAQGRQNTKLSTSDT